MAWRRLLSIKERDPGPQQSTAKLARTTRAPHRWDGVPKSDAKSNLFLTNLIRLH